MFDPSRNPRITDLDVEQRTRFQNYMGNRFLNIVSRRESEYRHSSHFVLVWLRNAFPPVLIVLICLWKLASVTQAALIDERYMQESSALREHVAVPTIDLYKRFHAPFLYDYKCVDCPRQHSENETLNEAPYAERKAQTIHSDRYAGEEPQTSRAISPRLAASLVISIFCRWLVFSSVVIGIVSGFFAARADASRKRQDREDVDTFRRYLEG